MNFQKIYTARLAKRGSSRQTSIPFTKSLYRWGAQYQRILVLENIFAHHAKKI